MTAKEWLNRGWKLNKEVEALDRAKLTLYVQCTRITPSYGAGSGSGSFDPHKMDRYVEFCERIDARIKELTRISAEIFSAICRIQDSRYRMLLYHRYMNFMTWDAIAETMGYSRVHVTRMHSEALKEMGHVLECYIHRAYNGNVM